MKGLWHLPTRTIDVGGLGVVAFDAIIAGLVIIVTCIAIVRRPKQWPQALMLYVGMVLLSTFFFLHWIDIIIRHYRKPVTYNYIFFDCINQIFRVLSDIFILWGLCRVMRRYHSLRREDSAVSAIFTLLVFIGIYQLCLLFALAFVWLGFANLHVINEIATARSAFEVAFSAAVFVIAIVLLLTWGASYNDKFVDYEDYAPPLKTALTTAFVFLVIRSFCEIINVGQLNRWPDPLPTILRARDVVYGLFSLPLIICIACAIPGNSPETDDPLVAREKATIDDLTNRIIERLQQLTADGTRTAPDMDTFLKGFEERRVAPQTLPRVSPAWERAYMINDEIERLKRVYGKWTPIQKWQAASAETEEPAAEPAIGAGRTGSKRVKKMYGRIRKVPQTSEDLPQTSRERPRTPTDWDIEYAHNSREPHL